MKPFRLLQFNMQFGQVWDENDPDHAPVDLAATIAEIKRHDADIILLQEVEHAQAGGKQIDPPPNYTRLKAELTGYDAHFAYPRVDERELPFGIGLAIFSRTPLFDCMRRDIPSPPIEFDFYGETKTPTDRVMIGARTRIADRELQIYNTHLLAFFMLKSSSEIHGVQREVVADALQSSELPTLLAGDFNISNTQSIVGQYAEIGYKTVQESEITWRRRPYVLDHIFHNAALRPVAHQVVPTPASDHHLLIGDFVFAE